MTATVTLTRAGESARAKLPLAAILNRGSGPSVFVVGEGDTLALRKVEVASFNEDWAFVAAGVSAGDAVVTLGVQKLAPGDKVRIVENR